MQNQQQKSLFSLHSIMKSICIKQTASINDENLEFLRCSEPWDSINGSASNIAD